MCIEAAKIARSNQAELKIGYLRCYTEIEFHRALELFSEKHPDVEVSVAYGNHEELYNLLRRLIVIGRMGFMPVEETGKATPVAASAGTSIVRIPLVRGEEPILRNYCAFWKKDNTVRYVQEFVDILQAQFE